MVVVAGPSRNPLPVVAVRARRHIDHRRGGLVSVAGHLEPTAVSIPLFVGVNLPGRFSEFLSAMLHLEIGYCSGGSFAGK